MTQLSILHLSDVHFGHPDADNEQERLLDGIHKALEEYSIKSDLIVFTGDLAQKALPSEFQNGEDWLRKIQKVTGGKIIVCPGNHDISRPLADENMLRLAYPNEDSFARSKGQIYKSHSHIKPFIDWYKEAYNSDQVFIEAWKDQIFASSSKLDINGVPIHIAALNTAALSCDDNDEGKLCIDIAALNSSLSNADSAREFVIAIGHHPIDSWLTDWNSEKVNNILGQENGPHIYMHGHVHDQETRSSYKSDGSGITCFTAGAAYQGSKWPQSFSLLSIDFARREITTNSYCYSASSGRWDFTPSVSRPVPVSTPNISVPAEENSIREKQDQNVVKKGKKWDNPFDNVASNSLPPHTIPELFVDENNFINRISKSFDSMIEGQRGTGKTMLLRYLSIEVQSYIAQKDVENVLNYFRHNKIYTGIYSRLSNAGFNRSDFEVVKDLLRRESLFNHRVTLYLISDVIKAVTPLVKNSGNEEEILRKVSSYLKRSLNEEEFTVVSNWDELSDLTSDICDELIADLDQHIASLLPGGTPIEFNPRLTVSNTLKKILDKLHKSLKLTAPFFLLLDDFDTLTAEQQGFIFKVARERTHELVCFKYGLMTLGQKHFLAGEGITYREGDDYDHIPLQWHDKGLSSEKGAKGNYRKTVTKIANKRIESSNWPDEIKYASLYSNWSHGNSIRKEVRDNAQREYEETDPKSRPKDFNSLWSKQGDSRYFRHLRSKKIEHHYAGPDTIIDISSGIFRQFLEINSRIVSSALDRGWIPDSSKKIRQDVQNTTIREYSNDMLRSLGETAGDISSLSQCKFDVTSTHLINLSNSLIRLFSNRLYSDVKDAEVIAISVKGDLLTPSLAKSVLDVAVRESILQRRSIDYPSKTHSEGRLPTFSLNRRLAPKGNLGVKMQGRYEINIKDIELAATDTERFLSKFSSKKKIDIEDKQGSLL